MMEMGDKGRTMRGFFRASDRVQRSYSVDDR